MKRRPKWGKEEFWALLAILFTLGWSGCGGSGSNSVLPPPAGGNTLSISTSGVASPGEVQAPYQGTATANGGTPPYSWSVSAGQLPPGISVNAATGAISGTPTAAGSFSFTVKATDSATPTNTGTANVALKIVPEVQNITDSLYDAPLQASYQATLTASGGVSPYRWNISSGALPPGLTLDSGTGAISGTPTSAGQASFNVTVSDSLQPKSAATSKMMTLNVIGLQLDAYGGVESALSPSGGTGYFRLEQSAGRWLLVTPSGHYTWMTAVQSIKAFDGGTTYTDAIDKKYGNPPTAWPSQTVRRLLSWGFNAIGEYAAEEMLPVPTSNSSTGNSIQAPFIRLLDVSHKALKSPYNVKDIVYGTNPAYYTGTQSPFPDVYDPQFQLAAQDQANDAAHIFAQPLDPSPWLIGSVTDDADSLWGFKGTKSPNLGWIVAVTAPAQQGNSALGVTYADTTVFVKQAWATFLQNKYGSILALNAAWGSNYTGFGSNGGWGSGTGLLDEDGRNRAWIGQDSIGLTDTNATAAADMNEFLENRVAETYFSITTTAVRGATPHHLVFSPDPLSIVSRPEVLRAAGRHCDAVEIGEWVSNSKTPAQMASAVLAAYQAIAGVGTSCANCRAVPVFAYTKMTASADSPFGSNATSSPSVDFPTQQARGSAYAGAVTALFNGVAADGASPVLGIDWWSWQDKTVQGDRANNGLVTNLDNAYDGREGIVAAGADSWGYPTGGEIHSYGDFISAAANANWSIFLML